MEEAALLQGPVSALKKRLHSLLQEWLEHPVLDQLLAICHRLTGALAPPVTDCLVLSAESTRHAEHLFPPKLSFTIVKVFIYSHI